MAKKGSGNLNDTAQVDIGINIDPNDNIKKTASQIDDLTKKVDKLASTFDKVANSAETAAKILEHINNNVHIDDIRGSQIKLQSKGSYVRWNPTEPGSFSQANASISAINQSIGAETDKTRANVEILKKTVENFDKLVNNDTLKWQSKTESAKAQQVRNIGYNLRQQSNAGWYTYRSLHPENFDPVLSKDRYNLKYQAGSGLITVGRGLSNLGSGGQALGYLVETLGASLKSPAMAAGVAIGNLGMSITNLAKEAVSAYAEIESIKTNLSVVYGSQTQSDDAFSQISQYAIKSPFGIQQTSELAILLKQSGVYASDLMDTLKMLGDTAGGNMEKMKRIANNYAQIVSIGKASMLDMRQFAYAGIPIFEAVSKELGVSQQQLRKLISDGKVTSDIIEKVFKDLTGVNGLFENATEKGAKTLKARLQNLNDIRQLMMSSVGDAIVNYGSANGNESFVKRGLSFTENIFSQIKDAIDKSNVARDVEAIKNKESKIDKLTELRDFFEATGNKSASKIVQEKIDELMSEMDIDTLRATYYKSYQQKTNPMNEIAKKEAYVSPDELSKQAYDIMQKNGMSYWDAMDIVRENNKDNTVLDLWELKKKLYDLEEKRNALNFDNILDEIPYLKYKNGEKLPKFLTDKYTKYDEYQLQIKELSDVVAKLENGGATTEEERLANYQVKTLEAQTAISDLIDKNNSKTGSVFNLSSAMKQMIEASPEWQQKKQEEELKSYKDVIKILTEISKNTNPENEVDVTQMSGKDFQNYISQGAISKKRDLTVTEINDKQLMSSDREILYDQYKYFSGLVEEGLKNTPYYLDVFKQKGSKFTGNELTDTQFYSDFDEIFTNQIEFLNNVNPELAKLLKNTTVLFETDLTPLQWDESMYSKIKTKGTPLWKRILASATGVSAQNITDVNQTLSAYSDDLALRTNASNVFSAYLKNGGNVDTIQSLLRTNGVNKKLQYDTNGTYQIDWKATNDAVRQFTKGLSASTTLLDAYKNGIQSQIDVYTQLLSSGITQGESADNVQKLMSTKAWGKLVVDSGEQLVNAFGEKLTDNMGNQITSIVDGKYYTTQGEVAQENVRIQGNIFDFIKKKLPDLQKELHNVTVGQAKNSILSGMQSGGLSSLLIKLGLQNTNADIASVISGNAEGYVNLVKTNVVTEGYNSLEDLLTAYFNNDAIAIGRINAAVWRANNDIQDIINSPGFIGMQQNTLNSSRTSALNADFETFKTLQTHGSSISGQMSYNKSQNSSLGYSWDAIRYRSFESDILSQLKIENATVEDLVEKQKDQDKYKAIQQDIDTDQKAIATIMAKWGGKTTYSDEYFSQLKKLQNEIELYQTKMDNVGYKHNLEVGMNEPYSAEERSNYNDAWSKQYWAKKRLEELQANKSQYEIPAPLGENEQRQLDAWNANLKRDTDELKALTEADETLVRSQIAAASMAKSFEDISNSLSEIAKTSLEDTVVKPFETLGEDIWDFVDGSKTMSDYWSDLGTTMKSIAGEMLSNLGTEMATCGFRIAAAGALENKWGIVAAGLGLAAAGGVASGLGSALSSASSSSDDSDEETDRLETLTEKLQDILEQAKIDADYYEKNLRHKNALSINDVVSVNDAVITKDGTVVKTSPQDYLIATKTPEALGGTGTVNVVINPTVQNNSSAGVTARTEQKKNSDGSIDIITIIEDAVGSYIASEKSDNAFAIRQARVSGNSYNS